MPNTDTFSRYHSFDILDFSLYPILYTIIIGFTDLKGLGRTDIHFETDDILSILKCIIQ